MTEEQTDWVQFAKDTLAHGHGEMTSEEYLAKRGMTPGGLPVQKPRPRLEDLTLTMLQDGEEAYVNRDQGIKDPVPVGALLVEIERTLGIPVAQLDVSNIGHFGFYVKVVSSS